MIIQTMELQFEKCYKVTKFMKESPNLDWDRLWVGKIFPKAVTFLHAPIVVFIELGRLGSRGLVIILMPAHLP